jgi:hypothetical protein
MCPICKAKKSEIFDPVKLLTNNNRLCFEHAFNDFLENLDYWLQVIKDEREAQRRKEREAISKKQVDHYESKSLPKQPL